MESSKSDSESPDQAEFRSDNKCAQCMQVLYLQSEQVNSIHNLEDIHIQSSTSTAAIVLQSIQTHAMRQHMAAVGSSSSSLSHTNHSHVMSTYGQAVVLLVPLELQSS